VRPGEEAAIHERRQPVDDEPMTMPATISRMTHGRRTLGNSPSTNGAEKADDGNDEQIGQRGHLFTSIGWLVAGRRRSLRTGPP
jgi:hypothetical protein